MGMSNTSLTNGTGVMNPNVAGGGNGGGVYRTCSFNNIGGGGVNNGNNESLPPSPQSQQSCFSSPQGSPGPLSISPQDMNPFSSNNYDLMHKKFDSIKLETNVYSNYNNVIAMNGKSGGGMPMNGNMVDMDGSKMRSSHLSGSLSNSSSNSSTTSTHTNGGGGGGGIGGGVGAVMDAGVASLADTNMLDDMMLTNSSPSTNMYHQGKLSATNQMLHPSMKNKKSIPNIILTIPNGKRFFFNIEFGLQIINNMCFLL